VSPAPSGAALAIYDAQDTRVAQVIDRTSAIVSDGTKHYQTVVKFQDGNIVLGAAYEILYNSPSMPCGGQAWYCTTDVTTGDNYLSQLSPLQSRYLVDTRPDGVYLTKFGTFNVLSGLEVWSFQTYVNGQLTCTNGIGGVPGFPKSANAVEIEQANSTTKVGGAGPYTVK
jgi:hypothetical protein